MAITQILARVDHETAVSASLSELGLDALIGLQLRDAEAYCDFGWAPKYIELAVRFGAPAELLLAVESAFEGESLLNPLFPDGSSGYTAYSEIRANSVSKVHSLASELSALPVAAISQTKARAQEVLPSDELPTDYETYVCAHVKVLMVFYAEAAKRNQVVVTWWD